MQIQAFVPDSFQRSAVSESHFSPLAATSVVPSFSGMRFGEGGVCDTERNEFGSKNEEAPGAEAPANPSGILDQPTVTLKSCVAAVVPSLTRTATLNVPVKPARGVIDK